MAEQPTEVMTFMPRLSISGRERVPEQVGIDPLGQAGLLPDGAHQLLESRDDQSLVSGDAVPG
jgi:hypothetical protein